jgi:PPM family protein phosphatase
VVYPTQSLGIEASGRSDLGNRRLNEDSFLLRPELHLYAVADGAGGPGIGNVASTMGLAAIASYIEETEQAALEAPPIDAFGLYTGARRLAIAIQRANQAIITLARSSKKLQSLASTVVAMLLDPERGLLHLGHLGDSRCYRYRAGLLELLTTDHSLLHDVLELRPDTDDGALAKLPRLVVTRALGMEQVRADIRSHEVLPGDKYLLCSDGVSGSLNNHQLAEVLGTRGTADQLVADLLMLATFPAPEDNVTALIVCSQLAPGSTLAERPRPPSSPRAPSSPAAPEILLRTRSGADTEHDPQFSVIPSESATEGLVDSSGHWVDALTTLVSGPGTQRIPSRHCSRCDELLAPSALFCPHCGARVT